MPIIITEAYFPKLLENPQEANDWLRQTLMQLECLDDEGILAERLLFPVNVNSNHWILIDLNIKAQTYWPYDPFSPAHPSSSDIVAAELIANAFLKNLAFISIFSFVTMTSLCKRMVLIVDYLYLPLHHFPCT